MKGYKKTEIVVIPEDWEVKRLGEIFNIKRGASPRPIEKYITKNKGVNWIKISDLKPTDKYLVKTEIKISYKGAEQSVIVNNNDLILSNSMSYGRAYISKIRGCIHDGWLLLKGKENIEFFYYLLNYSKIQKKFNLLAAGSGVNNLKIDSVKNLLIPLPSLPEQKAIAKVLSDIDSLIENLDKLIQKKKLIKKGVMQELLTGKKRLPGFKGEWIRKKLGEIAQIYQPETISQEKLSNKAKFYVYGANGIIGKYDYYNHRFWQNIITCRGSTCGTINKTTDYCWITGNAMVINVDNNRKIDKLFLFYLLKNQDFSKLITGSGQPQIIRQPLLHFEIILPPTLEEQKAIAKILSDIDADIESLERKKEKYEKIKKGAMELLLTGKVRLRKDND